MEKVKKVFKENPGVNVLWVDGDGEAYFSYNAKFGLRSVCREDTSPLTPLQKERGAGGHKGHGDNLKI